MLYLNPIIVYSILIVQVLVVIQITDLEMLRRVRWIVFFSRFSIAAFVTPGFSAGCVGCKNGYYIYGYYIYLDT